MFNYFMLFLKFWWVGILIGYVFLNVYGLLAVYRSHKSAQP